MCDLEKEILNKNLDRIREILENEPSEIDKKDDDGILMAFLAAKTGDIAIVRYVVEYSRASMNIYDDRHQNMLHYGVMSGNAEVCRYLVERVGISPVEGDIDRQTPYELASQLGYAEIENFFEEKVGAKLCDMYKNPIRQGFFPDPSIVRVGEDYYMVNSSFVYFPCIPISHSKDLIHWEIIGHAVTEPSYCMLDGIEGGRGYWAPDISYHDGRFYIAVTFRLNDYGTVYRKQLVMSSDKPEGPYTKPAIIDEDGIDPSIFFDEDGRRYMLLNRGARIFELNEDCTRQISEAVLLYYGDNKRAPEGPHLLKKDGYYYLFEAEGGTGMLHKVTVSRSKTLMGLYEPCPYNPIMTQKDTSAALQRCGHGKPVQTADGDWYMVYLCGRRLTGENGQVYSMLGRETALDPVTWTPDGWPIVNNLKGPSCLQKKPFIKNLPEDISVKKQEGGFDKDKLFGEWLSVRAPREGGFEVLDGELIIKGSRYELDSMAAENIIVRRQDSFNFTAVCEMEIPELSEGQNCGSTCYYDENTFVKFGVFKRDGKLYLGVVEHIGDDTVEHGFTQLDEKEKFISFKIVTQGLSRSFICKDNEVKLDNVYYLCDEGIKRGKRFTGAMVGMYAFAGEDKELFVRFKKFTYNRE